MLKLISTIDRPYDIFVGEVKTDVDINNNLDSAMNSSFPLMPIEEIICIVCKEKNIILNNRDVRQQILEALLKLNNYSQIVSGDNYHFEIDEFQFTIHFTPYVYSSNLLFTKLENLILLSNVSIFVLKLFVGGNSPRAKLLNTFISVFLFVNIIYLLVQNSFNKILLDTNETHNRIMKVIRVNLSKSIDGNFESNILNLISELEKEHVKISSEEKNEISQLQKYIKTIIQGSDQEVQLNMVSNFIEYLKKMAENNKKNSSNSNPAVIMLEETLTVGINLAYWQYIQLYGTPINDDGFDPDKLNEIIKSISKSI